MSKGLYNKYTVIKNDGTYKEAEGDFFVLRLDSDPHARKAAIAYAESVKESNPHLSFDLYQRVLEHNEKQVHDKSKS